MVRALMPSPAAGFDDPFALMAACHDRVRRSLDLLARLTAHLAEHGADAAAQSAARDVLRYFDLAAPHHHQDEERHLLPLLQVRPHAAALADRLVQDHRALERDWALARQGLQRVAEGIPEVPPPMLAHWADWSERLRKHASWEDAEVYPLLADALDRAQWALVGKEMAQRRGLKESLP